jgi:hypothetical protein
MEQVNYFQAARYCGKAFTLAKKEANTALLATTYAVKAQLALNRGAIPLALKYADTSEHLLKETVDRDLALYALASIARVHQKLENYERAEQNFLELLDSAFEGERVLAIGNVLLELAFLYEVSQNLEKAATCYRAARAVGFELPSRMQVKSRQAERRFRISYSSKQIEDILARPAVDWRQTVRYLLSR